MASLAACPRGLWSSKLSSLPQSPRVATAIPVFRHTLAAATTQSVPNSSFKSLSTQCHPSSPNLAASFSILDTILRKLWDGILLAVPKQKQSHSRSRSRRMTGKALKDVQGLNTCSACGRVKRAHLLCPYCVQNIKDMWSGKLQRMIDKVNGKDGTGASKPK
ncbi:MAG: hypothetical protein M1828_007168 [Chrysothrix sp. TS-e1954]|nr:MAG: hypothetical protein M1828_007168 [Chrysothrix sp. TS-e1954]